MLLCILTVSITFPATNILRPLPHLHTFYGIIGCNFLAALDWYDIESEMYFAAAYSQRLTLLYLCNDIVQTCKRKHAVVYKDAFKEVLRDVALLIRLVCMQSAVSTHCQPSSS